MTNKQQDIINTRSIFTYFYGLVGTILLLLVITALFILWRYDQLAEYNKRLSQYHIASTVSLDVLVSDLNQLEYYLTNKTDQRIENIAEQHDRDLNLSDLLYAVNKHTSEIISIERSFGHAEFANTVNRLEQRHSLFSQAFQRLSKGNEFHEQWYAAGRSLIEPVKQLQRLHIRDASQLGEELRLRQQSNLWLGFWVSLSLVLIGALIAVQIKHKIERMIGLQLATEGQFKSMLESAPDAMVIVNENGEIVLVNQAAETLFGYDRPELIGSLTSMLIPPDLQTSTHDYFGEILNQSHSLSSAHKYELVAKSNNGQKIQVEASFGLLQSESSPLIACTLRDISIRKRTEKALEYLARSDTYLSDSETFYSYCVHSLAEAYQAKYAFIGLIEDGSNDSVRSIAACCDGSTVDNFQYDLQHTPCELVMAEDKQLIQQGAMARYPKDDLLQQMGMDAYYGAPLISSSGEKFGLVVVGHTSELVMDHWTELLLDVYSVRIANELEREKTRQELLNSQKDLLEAQANAHIGSWKLDKINNALTVSDEVFRILEISKDKFDASYEAFRGAIHPEDKEVVSQAYESSVTNRKPYKMEYRLLFPDDRIKHVVETCETYYNDQGKHTHSVGTVQDITDRYEMELALRESEQYNRELFELSPIGLALTQMDGTLVDVNPAFTNILGRTISETMGMSYWEITPFKYADQEQEQLQNLEKNGHYGPYEKEYIHSDGHLVPVRLSGLIIQHDSTPHIWSSVEDITLQKEIERARIKSEEKVRKLNEELESRVETRTRDIAAINKELESFNYSVSHDLRTPLRALDGYSFMLMQEYGSQLDDKAQDYIERIQNGAKRMGLLIDGLLNLSHIKTHELQQDTVDLSGMVHEIAQTLSEKESSRQLQWVIEDGLVCQADNALVHILLQNLIENAWKYTAKTADARIEFGVSSGKKQPVYYVKDNGVGFNMQYADKLFRAFHRLHSDDEGFTGLGIGLATVSRIIERHGGHIRAEAAVNQGASFYFTLDRQQEQPVAIHRAS